MDLLPIANQTLPVTDSWKLPPFSYCGNQRLAFTPEPPHLGARMRFFLVSF